MLIPNNLVKCVAPYVKQGGGGFWWYTCWGKAFHCGSFKFCAKWSLLLTTLFVFATLEIDPSEVPLLLESELLYDLSVLLLVIGLLES